jgi:hypothetical protein
MRAGIGLLSLLVAAAIIFYISFGGKNGGYEGTVLKEGQTGREEASQIAGRTIDNVPIENTIKLDEVDSGGQFRRLKVLSVDAQTPMDTDYGLKPGDEISRVGDMGVSDNNDPGLAKALVYEAYSRNESLTVQRAGQEITLSPTKSPLSVHQPGMFNFPSQPGSSNSSPVPTGAAIPTPIPTH